MTLKQKLRSIYPEFPEEHLDAGLEKFTSIELQAKDHLMDLGTACNALWHVESSITRCYYHNSKGEEHTLWMKPEGSLLTEYDAFISGNKSRFGLQVYEPTNVQFITRNDLLNLTEKHLGWAQFYFRFMEGLHVSLINVFVNLLSNDATDNYRYIEYAFPRFIQVAPLKDIASMLQVSQVSLSRIRAGKQSKRTF